MFLCEGFSLVAASGGHSSSRCAGLSLLRPFLLRSTGSRCAGSVVVAHGPSCSAACGIFPDQGSNPCPLHWQADSQPLRHQGSPDFVYYYSNSLSVFLLILKAIFIALISKFLCMYVKGEVSHCRLLYEVCIADPPLIIQLRCILA